MIMMRMLARGCRSEAKLVPLAAKPPSRQTPKASRRGFLDEASEDGDFLAGFRAALGSALAAPRSARAVLCESRFRFLLLQAERSPYTRRLGPSENFSPSFSGFGQVLKAIRPM